MTAREEESPVPLVASSGGIGQTESVVKLSSQGALVKPIIRPGISSATLDRAGVVVDDLGLRIPYHDTHGRPINFNRWRLSQPRGDQKYHQLKDTGVHAYLPVMLWELEATDAVVITEGEFKALSLCEAGIPAIGTPGLSVYQKDENGKPELINLLAEAIARLKPSRLLHLGDNDTSLNFEFSRNAIALAELTSLPVSCPRIPLNGPGKGCDDCKASLNGRFNNWWDEMVEKAEPVDVKFGPPVLALRLLRREWATITAAKDNVRDEYVRRLVRLGAALFRHEIQFAELSGMMSDLQPSLTKPIFKSACRKILQQQVAEVAASKPQIETAAPDSKPDSQEPANTTAPVVFDNEIVQRFGPPVYGLEKRVVINESFWAGLFVDKHRVLWEPAEREFYQYCHGTGLWTTMSSETVQQGVSSLLLDYSASEELAMLAPMRSLRTLQSITGQLKGVAEKRNPFVAHEPRIHCKNVMLVFREDGTIEERGFNPEFYSRNGLPVAYDPDAQCPRFLNELVLPAVDAADASLLQRWFGCAILQINLPQRLLILDGEAGRGKTQLGTVARCLVGEENVGQLRTEQLGQRFETYRLRNKSLLLGADVRGDFLMNESAYVLKALVGGDCLSGERKGSNECFPMRGTFNVLVTSNERLRIHLNSDVGAWRRRLLIIRFECPPPVRKIPDIGLRLFREEGSGILNWSLQGAQQLLAEIQSTGDYVLSAGQQERIDNLLSESDSLSRFIQTGIEEAPTCTTTKTELIEAYYGYCTDNRWQPMPRNIVERQLPDLMLRYHGCSESHDIKRNDKNCRGYRDIRLTT